MMLCGTEHVFVQDSDCCSAEDNHEMKVTMDNGGGGPFLTLSVNRWAFDNENEIQAFADTLKSIYIEGERKNWIFALDSLDDEEVEEVE